MRAWRKLQERLAVIDTAQSNIQSLAGQVVQLQAILSNKQTRGAFGQSRMEAIVADGLPHGAYEFQATLSNGNRPDCLVKMPNGAPSLVIDAKFPLEAWNAIRAAADSDGSEAQKYAAQAFRRDIEVHIKAISEKYLISGETQDTAFMFVPSESIFAEIHENFEAIVQKAHRARIVIVSPSLLMLSIQVIQAILKDARMREQAHLIQGEVVRLMEDLSRLDDRVRKLQTHFGQATKDIDDILVSSNKVTKRGQKIEALEFGAASPEGDGREAEPRGVAAKDDAAAVGSRTGQLRLRVVDEGELTRSRTASAPSLLPRRLRIPAATAAPNDARSGALGARFVALAHRADADAVNLRPVADRGRVEMRAALAAKAPARAGCRFRRS